MAAIEHRFRHPESQERWRAATSSTSSRQNDRTQFPVKCRRSKRKPRKAITQLAARYVAATTTSFFTNESSSFEQISTRRPKISPARPMATSTMKKANRNSPCVIIPSHLILDMEVNRCHLLPEASDPSRPHPALRRRYSPGIRHSPVTFYLALKSRHHFVHGVVSLRLRSSMPGVCSDRYIHAEIAADNPDVPVQPPKIHAQEKSR